MQRDFPFTPSAFFRTNSMEKKKIPNVWIQNFAYENVSAYMGVNGK
jgi:hypothetical protein